jgi:prolyl-tRNA synthetase
MSKETGLKLTAKKSTEFSDWYSQVIVMSEMIDYYEVRCPFVFLKSSTCISSNILLSLSVSFFRFPLFLYLF